jgi:hypothetical protein
VLTGTRDVLNAFQVMMLNRLTVKNEYFSDLTMLKEARISGA